MYTKAHFYEGDVLYDTFNKIWSFKKGSLNIRMVAWEDTLKGPLIEVFLEENQKRVIFEILEKYSYESLINPSIENLESSAEKVIFIIRKLYSLELHSDQLVSFLKRSARNLLQGDENFCAIHIYYEFGLFFGIKKTVTGKLKDLEMIPPRIITSKRAHYLD